MRRRRVHGLRSRRCSTAACENKLRGSAAWTVRRCGLGDSAQRQGPNGLVNKSSPGALGKMTDEHKALLTRLVEEGLIPAVDGVVRWRSCDLIMWLREEFGISVSDDTVYRGLEGLEADAMEAFKKAFPPARRKSARSLHLALR